VLARFNISDNVLNWSNIVVQGKRINRVYADAFSNVDGIGSAEVDIAEIENAVKELNVKKCTTLKAFTTKVSVAEVIKLIRINT
jgi:hypothetical protein